MSVTHVIYHIPGHKVGCTRNLENRRGWYPKDTVIEILEELHDKTDQEAGDIEWAWADKFGYRRWNHFTVTVGVTDNLTAEQISNRGKISGKIGGRRRAESGNTPIYNMTFEQHREIGKKNGRRLADLGITPFHLMSQEQRLENASKGGARAAELGLSGFKVLTTAQRVEIAASRKRGKCPHCGLEGFLFNLRRWHFDNCPHKPKMRTARFVWRAP
jgi:hypothetical protein